MSPLVLLLQDECTDKCVAKYLKAAERIGKRFAEEQQLQQETDGGAAGR